MSPRSARRLESAPHDGPIPLSLVRDLVAVSLLTEDGRPPARWRLERALGRELAARLLERCALARHAA